jgi:phosphatidate cytidylyltransferase
MKTRILSALVMLPLLLLVFIGGWALWIACLLASATALWEFFRSFEASGVRPSRAAAAFALLSLYGLGAFAPESGRLYMLWFALVVFLSFLSLFRAGRRELADGAATMTGIFYVCFFSFHVVLMDQARACRPMIWLIFLTAFGTDIMAYFTGLALGRHKLCPEISPKKTVEGAVGGLLGSVLFCGLFGYFALPDLLPHCLILGALGGALSQIGDLTASIFKRKLGVKDYGRLIPGHGGVLDRLDSVLFTAPLVYYYAMALSGGLL